MFNYEAFESGIAIIYFPFIEWSFIVKLGLVIMSRYRVFSNNIILL